MEAIAEQLVSIYLTRGGKVFIAPQYSIPNPQSNAEWACPDFVALDFSAREVVVVEVATGANPAPIIKKVEDRTERWFDPLRARLIGDGVTDENWRLRFLGFVRCENLKAVQNAFASADDVTFMNIEDASFSWKYWDGRASNGLPGSKRK